MNTISLCRCGLLAGAFTAIASVGFGQVMPTIRAIAQAGFTTEDSNVVTVSSLPGEASRVLMGSTGAEAISSVIGDFHLRQQVTTGSSSGSEARAEALFEFGPNANTDRLIFTAATETRVARLHWEIEYEANQDSNYSYTENGGSGYLQWGFSGTGRIWTGFGVRGVQNFSANFFNVNESNGSDITPVATAGYLEFNLNSGESLELGSVNLASYASATGSLNNLVESSLVVNAWVWVEVMTPGIELLDTRSIFESYSATSATAVPEPSTYAAIGGALALGLAVWRRRRAR